MNLANAAFSGCDGNHVCEVFMRGVGAGILIVWLLIIGALIHASLHRETS